MFEKNQKRLHTWASLVKGKYIFLSCDSAAVALTKHERGYILGICLKKNQKRLHTWDMFEKNQKRLHTCDSGICWRLHTWDMFETKLEKMKN